MDQSIRSSHTKGSQCKLFRIDHALQETTQRFVESLSKDIRISQHCDPDYASKKLESDVWFWLKPTDAGKPGYLIFLPNQPAIWIDEQFKFSFKIPIRVSPSIYEKKSVFIASLDRQDSLLRLEDAWMVAGDFLRSKSFSKRWDKLTEFFYTHFKSDSHLQQGLRIELASLSPLSSISSWKSMLNIPFFMFAQGESSPRRLRIPLSPYPSKSNNPPKTSTFSNPTQNKNPPPDRTSISPRSSPSSTPPHKSVKNSHHTLPTLNPLAPSFILDSEDTDDNTHSTDPKDATAVPHESYPDTYNIFIKNVKKGFAAVQDLDMSIALRNSKSPIRVKVSWNDEFKMYEICQLLTE